jgi:hypothetical protein
MDLYLRDAFISYSRKDKPSVCGIVLVATVNPACLSFGTVSDAGNSAQSTAPDSSAAARAEASGIGNSSSRSVFGTRALSQ